MASLKDIRKRVGSVKNTQKITRAMKMVAASKLRRSQQALMAARPYAQHMSNLVGHLATLESDHPAHPLLQARESVKRVQLVVLTSDRGFCGGFNGTLLRQVWEWLKANEANYEAVTIQMIGRKGRDFLRARQREVEDFETGIYEGFDYAAARRRALQLLSDYESGSWDECIFVYNRFKSAMVQDVVFQKVVPITPDLAAEPEAGGEYVPDYIYEPTAPLLLGELLPRYLTTDIYRIFLDSIASEFGARMVAMDAASNNCSDMIDKLTLQGNRLRQAAITNDLMDIVNGAEALR